MAGSRRLQTKEARSAEAMIDGGEHLVIRGPISSNDIPGLTARVVASVLQSHALSISCDVGAIVHPAAEAIDALARLQLSTHRLGTQLCLRNVSPELLELLRFAGLDEVLRFRD